MEMLPLQNAITAILAQLSGEEKNGGVVYVASEPIFPGTRLQFPKLSIEPTSSAFLAFVDRDPMANWSHSARYVLFYPNTQQIESFEAGLPPFTSEPGLHWRVAYKADSVPDGVLASIS